MLQEIEDPPGLTGGERWSGPNRRTFVDILCRAALAVTVFHLSLTGSFDAFRYLTCEFRMTHLIEDAARVAVGSAPEAGIAGIEARLAERMTRSQGDSWRLEARVAGSARELHLSVEGRLTPLNPLLKLALGAWTFRRDLDLARP